MLSTSSSSPVYLGVRAPTVVGSANNVVAAGIADKQSVALQTAQQYAAANTEHE